MRKNKNQEAARQPSRRKETQKNAKTTRVKSNYATSVEAARGRGEPRCIPFFRGWCCQRVTYSPRNPTDCKVSQEACCAALGKGWGWNCKGRPLCSGAWVSGHKATKRRRNGSISTINSSIRTTAPTVGRIKRRLQAECSNTARMGFPQHSNDAVNSIRYTGLLMVVWNSALTWGHESRFQALYLQLGTMSSTNRRQTGDERTSRE